MKYYVEFLRLLDDEEKTYTTPIVTGKIQEGKKQIVFEIGIDESGEDILIVFGDMPWTIHIKTDELVLTGRKFAQRIKESEDE